MGWAVITQLGYNYIISYLIRIEKRAKREKHAVLWEHRTEGLILPDKCRNASLQHSWPWSWSRSGSCSEEEWAREGNSWEKIQVMGHRGLWYIWKVKANKGQMIQGLADEFKLLVLVLRAIGCPWMFYAGEWCYRIVNLGIFRNYLCAYKPLYAIHFIRIYS